MHIGIIPYNLRKTKKLGTLSLNAIDWPNQSQPPGNTVADLTQDDHIILYPSSKMFFRCHQSLNCNVSLLLAEPKAIHNKYYRLMLLLSWKFFHIFTRYTQFERPNGNVHTLPIVESWVDSSSNYSEHKKTQQCSLIASAKHDQIGHKLRHRLVQYIKDTGSAVSVLGRGYQSFDKKEEGLLDYRLSMIIENCQEDDYFTEKLLDCILCHTIPIYWGCPNIHKYFDIRGMIICHTEAELVSTLNKLSELNDFGLNAAPYLLKNAKKARQYCQLNKRIYDKMMELYPS